MLEWDSRPMARNTSCIAGASPMISGVWVDWPACTVSCSLLWASARLIDVKGLGQILEGAALIGGDRTVQVRVRGHDDHRQTRVQLADIRQQLQAAAAGHADIADQNIGPLLPVQAQQGAVGAVEAGRFHAVLLQGLLQNPADGAVVIDDPDIGGLAHSSSPGSGRNRVKVVWPGTLSHSMRPWCRVTMFWVIDSPRPVPSAR